MDQGTLSLMQKLAPDLLEQMCLRAMVLERISALQPVGRRAIAQRLQLQEREVRTISEALKQAGYITVGSAGMALTERASEVLPGAREMVRSMLGITSLELQLARMLHAERVVLVPGNADEDKSVLGEVGRAAAQRLRPLLREGAVLAVTGGTTVAQVAHSIPHGSPQHVMVLPARGGVGRNLETQADTLAAEMARRLGGHHRLMHLPDTAGAEAMRELMKLPEIRELLDMLKEADVLLYGIGRADDMAVNRRLSPEARARVLALGAVAEALGYYFDRQGRAVKNASNVGLDVEHVENIPTVIAVAAGARKAEAILAVTRHHRHELLVMDEGAAHALMELLKRGSAP